MNTNSRFAVVLVVVSAFFAGNASAASLPMRDEANFVAPGVTQIAGSVVPPVAHGSQSNITTDGTNLTINIGGNSDPFVIMNGFGSTTLTNGYTVEADLRVSQANTDNLGTFVFNLDGASSGNNGLFDLIVSPTGIINFNGATAQTVFTGDMTQFNTIRLAVTPTSATLFVNGVDVADNLQPTTTLTLDRVLFGSDGGAVTSGATQLSYLRVDTTGAFAPIVPAPEPGTLVLLGLGVVALAGRRVLTRARRRSSNASQT